MRAALRREAGRDVSPEPAAEPLLELVEAVRRHRVAELLEPHAGALGLSPETAQAVGALRSAGRRVLMVQLLEIERLRTLLGDAGISFLLIKGPALAVQTAGDPAARGGGDVDLLVAPADVVAAHELLQSSGWRVRPSCDVEPGTWAWRHVMRSFNALTYDSPASAVDLHWRLDPTLDALPTFAEAWERRVPVDLGAGLVVDTLCHDHLLGHTSLHAAKDSWRYLRNLVDVHRLAADPRTWERDLVADPLRKLELRTLAVARFAIGLPDTVPDDVLHRLDQVPPSVVSRAMTFQERPIAAEYFPGKESVRLLRYMLAASPTGRDLRHSTVSTVLPVKSVVGVQARSAVTGVPQTLWRRVLRLGRRSADWARREPAADVPDPLVRTQR